MLTLVSFVATPEMDRLLKSHSGPVGADMIVRARRVEAIAKALCPVNKKVGHGGGGLRASIHADSIARSDSRGLYADVGSNLEYAIHVEQGTPPRVIVPDVKKALWWEGITAGLGTPRADSPSRGPYQGKGLSVKSVNHPGTKAQPYLRPALLAAS